MVIDVNKAPFTKAVWGFKTDITHNTSTRTSSTKACCHAICFQFVLYSASGFYRGNVWSYRLGWVKNSTTEDREGLAYKRATGHPSFFMKNDCHISPVGQQSI